MLEAILIEAQITGNLYIDIPIYMCMAIGVAVYMHNI